MMSIVHLFAISILIVCGPVLRQAYAEQSVTLEVLEALGVVTGMYSNEDQITTQMMNSNGPYNDNVTLSYLGLDIPALNEYMPILFKEYLNDVLIREAIGLTLNISDIGYLNIEYFLIQDSSKLRVDQLNVADMTRGDLVPESACKGQIIPEINQTYIPGFRVIQGVGCSSTDGSENGSNYILYYSDTYLRVHVSGQAPEKNIKPYVFQKIQDHPIPESWYTRLTEA